jgi:RNA polymerase sigma factor (sigma-70 family)
MIDQNKVIKNKRDYDLSEEKWQLVVDNMKLVDMVFRFFSSKFPSANEDMDDYIEAGTWGLIHAARNFDKTRNVKFITYAFKAMRRDMARVFAINQKRKARFVSREAMAEKYNEDDSASDQFVPVVESNILEDLIGKEKIKAMMAIIKEAPDKYKKVIKKRFFENKTFDVMGKELSVTREMARLYCKDAIKYVSTKFKSKYGD